MSSCINSDDRVCFIPFVLLMRCIASIDYVILNHPCIFVISHTWVWGIILFLCCETHAASILLEVPTFILIGDIDL